MNKFITLLLVSFITLGCVSDDHIILPDGGCLTCMNNLFTGEPLNYSADDFIKTSNDIRKRSKSVDSQGKILNTQMASKKNYKGSIESNISSWMKKSLGSDYEVQSMQLVMLENREKAYLVTTNEDTYALARPELRHVKLLDEILSDIITGWNFSIETINITNKPSVFILENTKSSQGYAYGSRDFFSLDGWKVNEHYEHVSLSDNTGTDVCLQGKEECYSSTSTYKILSKNPLKISETTISSQGPSINKMSKEKKKVKIININ